MNKSEVKPEQEPDEKSGFSQGNVVIQIGTAVMSSLTKIGRDIYIPPGFVCPVPKRDGNLK